MYLTGIPGSAEVLFLVYHYHLKTECCCASPHAQTYGSMDQKHPVHDVKHHQITSSGPGVIWCLMGKLSVSVEGSSEPRAFFQKESPYTHNMTGFGFKILTIRAVIHL